MIHKSPLRCAIYCRLSKDRSGQSENTGIQLVECREYAADEDWQIVAEFEENDTSASKFSTKPRPYYNQLVEMVRTNRVDVILSTESERLVRRPEEMSTLIDLSEAGDLKILAFTDDESFDLRTPNGIYAARTSVARGERESRKISVRQKRKKLAQAKAGKPNGGRPAYGFDVDNITHVESEKLIWISMADKSIGGQSNKSIAYWANEQGYPTKQGGKWTAFTVRNMLLNARYGGWREHEGIRYKAVWEPFVDQAKFERLQTAQRARLTGKKVESATKYLLTGLAICGRCGLRLTGTTTADRNDKTKRLRVYCCKTQGDTARKHGCSLRRNAVALDAFIRDAVIFRLDSPELGKLITGSKDADTELAKLIDDRTAQQQRKDELVSAYARGLLDDEELATARRAALDELQRIDEDIARRTGRTQVSAARTPGQTLREAWDIHDNDWRRDLIGLVVKRIVVMPGNTKPLVMVDGVRMRFDSKLIKIEWRDDE